MAGRAGDLGSAHSTVMAAATPSSVLLCSPHWANFRQISPQCPAHKRLALICPHFLGKLNTTPSGGHAAFFLSHCRPGGSSSGHAGIKGPMKTEKQSPRGPRGGLSAPPHMPVLRPQTASGFGQFGNAVVDCGIHVGERHVARVTDCSPAKQATT